jgi:outer membrane protein OmpA-like peptidoglycan-associated protein
VLSRAFARIAPTLFLVLVFFLPTIAQAQDEPSFDLGHFRPSTSPYSIFTAERSEVMPHLAFGTKLFFDYANEPLVGQTSEGVRDVIVDGTGTVNFAINMGLFELAELGINMPFVVLHDGALNGREFATLGVGDMSFRGKIKALDAADFGGFGLAAGFDLSVPTGAEEDFLGDGFLTFMPFVAADFRYGPVIVAANLGTRFRESSATLSYQHEHSLDYALAAQVEVVEALLDLSLETFGSLPMSGNIGEDFYRPMEWLAGARLHAPRELIFSVGGGTGIGQGVGAPKFRLFAGMEYAPLNPDRDGDGILNTDDQCPNEAEDVDGFEDQDGCPELDNDQDGVLDGDDQCPTEAEDPDGDRDEDGCPDIDGDGDGVPDEIDQCPDQAEDPDGFEDEDGCPDFDNDKDGIPDELDQCPLEAEDFDKHEDSDGCLDFDNDNDGILDELDDCPDQAEDPDGFEDSDGCPDPDNDLDGIEDAADLCPNEKETINGVDDEDGCPDQGKTVVVVEQSQIVILDKVLFETGKSDIKSDSFSLLNQVALTLKANPHIRRVRVEGHTDDVGGFDENMKLSQERAVAVVDYLSGRGVDAKRLEPVGYGPTRPIAEGKNKRAREKNRRVEFIILEQ